MTHVVVITDTHFGIKNNSQRWLSKQRDGIDELLYYIQRYKIENPGNEVVLIHCGDVFDSRSSINPMVLKEVRDMLYGLAGEVYRFFIIGGNHDYYSPQEEYLEVNTLDLLIEHGNIVLVTDGYTTNVVDGVKMGFIPWYSVEGKQQTIASILNKEKMDIVFTHTDLFGKQDFGIPVISGHIHTPQRFGRNFNICSAFATSFADTNSERGFYTFDCVEGCFTPLFFHPLKGIIRFHTFVSTSEDFFKPFDVKPYDYVRIYLLPEHRQDKKYMKVVEKCQNNCENVDVIIYNNTDVADGSFSDVIDIDAIIIGMLPEHLKEKFNNIKCMTSKN